MTTIYLIRHGQASAGGANYDVLSDTGRRQSAILGEHLNNIGLQFDAIYSGTLQRQIDTATIATDIPHAELAQRDSFNEYNHEAIFQRYAPILAATNEDVARVLEGGRQGRPKFMSPQAFMALMNAWATDTNAAAENSADKDPQVESFEHWQSFVDRIDQGLNNLRRDHPDQTIGVFTSGGVICTATQKLFSLNPAMIFDMNWGINNTSITTLRATGGTLRLREYNNIAHLLLHRDKTLVTVI